MRFEDAFKIVLGFEGGYVNDSDDRGGETNYGITASTLNSAKNKGWVPFNITIKDIKLEYAKTIYKKGYWDAVQADSNDMPVYGEVDFETLKQAKQFEISNKRYQAEVGGIEYNGAQIHTDRESQAKIQAAAMVALTRLTQGSLPSDVQSLIALLPTQLDWKGKNEWLEADDETIIQLAFLVFNHVQQCYQRERQLQEQIDQATTIEELNEIEW